MGFDTRPYVGKLITTTLEFSNWVQDTHEGLVAAGLRYIPAQGDFTPIDPESSQTVTNTEQHTFRIYEINDSYSVEQPLYIRIRFHTTRGASTTSVYVPAMQFTIGFELDPVTNELTGNEVEGPWSSYVTSASATPSFRTGRTVTVQGEGVFFHANGVGSGWQTANNVYQNGLVIVARVEDLSGAVNPKRAALIYPLGSIVHFKDSSDFRYQVIDADTGVGPALRDPFRLPRIHTCEGYVVANPIDLSSGGFLGFSKSLGAIRDPGPEWGETVLSMDGITERRYFIAPCARSTANVAPTAFESDSLKVVVSTVERSVGAIVVAIDE